MSYGRPPPHEVTQLVKGAIKDLKTIYPSSGSLFGGTPVDVKGPPGFMGNVSGGYCVFDDDIGTLEVMSNTTVRCRTFRKTAWFCPGHGARRSGAARRRRVRVSPATFSCRSNRPSDLSMEALLYYSACPSLELQMMRGATSAMPGRTLLSKMIHPSDVRYPCLENRRKCKSRRPTTADEIEVTTGPSFRIEKVLLWTRWSPRFCQRSEDRL